jgi:gamma-glutamyltranspeptidase / glutathione hydrolase
VADKWGNWVAATPSGWSGALIETNGVWLGSRMQSFNLWPRHPNRIEPGKRPRITLTPTIVLKEGRPVLAISVAGGDMQDQASLQLFLNAIEFGFSPAEAVAKPRFYTDHYIGSFGQTPPKLGNLRLTPGLEAAMDPLAALGHKVSIDPALGICCPVMLAGTQEEGFRAAGDAPTLRNVRAC